MSDRQDRTKIYVVCFCICSCICFCICWICCLLYSLIQLKEWLFIRVVLIYLRQMNWNFYNRSSFSHITLWRTGTGCQLQTLTSSIPHPVVRLRLYVPRKFFKFDFNNYVYNVNKTLSGKWSERLHYTFFLTCKTADSMYV